LCGRESLGGIIAGLSAVTAASFPARISNAIMGFFISDALAQGAAAPAPAGSPFSPLIVMVVFFAIFYFIAIRPQMKRAKEHRAMLGQLARGDEVITSGGLAGRVVELGDAFVDLEIAPNVTIKIQRHAISTVLPKGSLKQA